jgi:hypothetical protein
MQKTVMSRRRCRDSEFLSDRSSKAQAKYRFHATSCIASLACYDRRLMSNAPFHTVVVGQNPIRRSHHIEKRPDPAAADLEMNTRQASSASMDLASAAFGAAKTHDSMRVFS